MGAVYLAEHPLIGKKVALKVIHRELAGNKEVVQRFFQEAKAVTGSATSTSSQIHDFGQTPEGDHFYIMEYLEGQTLAQVIAKESVIDGACARSTSARRSRARSAAAHAAGVIHRDLKPDNVMLTYRLGDPDFVKLLDFGLAKMFARSGAVNDRRRRAARHAAVHVAGGVRDASRRSMHRTDVYALGILLFQMLTRPAAVRRRVDGRGPRQAGDAAAAGAARDQPEHPAERSSRSSCAASRRRPTPVPDDARAARGAARSRGVPAEVAADRAGALDRPRRGAGQRGAGDGVRGGAAARSTRDRHRQRSCRSQARAVARRGDAGRRR